MNGLLIVDKAGGMTSHDVVNRLRRMTGEQSIGHLGTLDPMATGVLPMLLGKFTRLAQYFGKLDKTYTGTIRLGFATDSYDADGAATTAVLPVTATIEQVRDAARHFHGEMEQMPPVFSAKKIGGKPAYKLAREGRAVDLKPSRIHIRSFEITGLSGDCASFEVSVSAGGYVRSIAHELGERLGCGGHLSSLRRTSAGPFLIDQALTLDQIAKLGDEEAIERSLVHPRALLPEMPSVTADEVTSGRIRNGAAINLPEYSNAPLVKVFVGQRQMIAIGKRVAGTLFQPVLVMS